MFSVTSTLPNIKTERNGVDSSPKKRLLIDSKKIQGNKM